ncbi:MAG: glycoside hydrolase family 2 TIM barrel-domain containing protein [Lentimonas sp.]
MKTVELVQTNQSSQLRVKGKSFRIRGAGGPASLKLLSEAGGNSTRTWGFDQLENGLLDDAYENGIMVSVGIWLRHDLDYNDLQQVNTQIAHALEGVRKYKDHPAILLWGVGNEMEGNGENIAIWKHVEEIAKLIKKEDPTRPTMTVIAEISGNKIEYINEHCPSIDIIGINAYGGAPSVPQRYREKGGSKPYILAEYGPRGPWDYPKNEINSLDESLTKTKSAYYLKAYEAIDQDVELGLGSYAFMWGQKMEATPTWFGMFLKDGRKTPTVDVMTAAWSGKEVENKSPQIDSIRLIGSRTVNTKSKVSAKIKASDPEGDPLKVEWVLMANSGTYITMGYKQATPPVFPENILQSSENEVTFRVPEKPGLYRIFAYVGDEHGGADAANIVFRAE